MRTIENDALTLEDVPLGTATVSEFISCSHTFDGYKYWGSFERCAEIANSKDHGSIASLRTCLFFEARRWPHFGEGPDHESIQHRREFIAAIRDKLVTDLDMTNSMITPPPDINVMCSKFFRYRDLIECGETQEAHRLPNLPVELKSYDAIKDLALNILDPVVEKFGHLKLTYGFSSLELLKKISSRVSPGNDQHAAHEKRRTGRHVCPRLGAACDFYIEKADMRRVAEWVYFNTPVDRLYFYRSDRPIHVSYSQSRAHQFVEMLPRQDKLIPKVIKIARLRTVSET